MNLYITIDIHSRVCIIFEHIREEFVKHDHIKVGDVLRRKLLKGNSITFTIAIEHNNTATTTTATTHDNTNNENYLPNPFQ